MKAEGKAPSLHFHLLAGADTFNCLGSRMLEQSFYTETYSFKGNTLYCTSRYRQSQKSDALKTDVQPLISGVDAWQFQMHQLQAQSDEAQACVQGLDLQLIFPTQVFQRRFIAPGCIQWI